MDIFGRLDEVLAFRHSLNSETDRGCALMAAAYLDDQLRLLLVSRMLEDCAVADELLRADGPLGTFSSRIDTAYMFGLIRKNVRRDLHLIRKVRNDFGHVASPLTFDHPPIAARCRELFHHGCPATDPPRGVFAQTVLGVVGILHAEILLATRPVPSVEGPTEDWLEQQHRTRLDSIGRILDQGAEHLDWSSEESYIASLKTLLLRSIVQDADDEAREQ